MAMLKDTYENVRPKMQPGDVIAFGGKSAFSELIKSVTRAKVSHTGVILQRTMIGDNDDRFFNEIIESTEVEDFTGVVARRFSDCLKAYKGDVWWLPLKKEIRETKFNQKEFFDFLFAQKGKYFDVKQSLAAGLDIFDHLPFGIEGFSLNEEDFRKFFCSELVAAGLEAGGVISNVNASEVTPIELCRLAIYEDDYTQLRYEDDPDSRISRYNTLDPSALEPD